MKKEDNDLSLLIPDAETMTQDPLDLPPLGSVLVQVPARCNCCPQVMLDTNSGQMIPVRPAHLNNKAESNLNWKLVLLLTIASAALVSIVVISQQLILRHMGATQQTSEPVTLELNIPESGWMSNEGLHHKLRYPGEINEDYMVEIIQMDDATPDSNSQLSGAYYHMLPEKYTSPKKLDHHGVKFHSPLTLKNKADVTLVEDGMYWSNEVINNVDPGLDEDTIEAELRSLRSRKVKSLEEPTWLKCGREQNRFVTFKDGVHACARYREPHNQLVLGEVMSFYLARLLGIHNVPAVILSQVDPNNPVWKSAMNEVNSSEWRVGSIVAMIQWVEDLVRDKMPNILKQALLARTTLDVTSDDDTYSDLPSDVTRVNIRDLDVTEAAELAQWSDLVVFDYLTANYDRVASMQDAAEKENRPEILSETVHNLAKSTRTGSLWLIDNESGMLDAYNLLYPQFEDSEAKKEGNRFKNMQRDMLQTTCIFKRSTVDKIFGLYKNGDTVSLLNDFINRNEPFYGELLRSIPGQDSAFRKHFQERVVEVWTWMKQCQENVKFW